MPKGRSSSIWKTIETFLLIEVYPALLIIGMIVSLIDLFPTASILRGFNAISLFYFLAFLVVFVWHGKTFYFFSCRFFALYPKYYRQILAYSHNSRLIYFIFGNFRKFIDKHRDLSGGVFVWKYNYVNKFGAY